MKNSERIRVACLLASILLIAGVTAQPDTGVPEVDEAVSKDYLQQFGFLGESSPDPSMADSTDYETFVRAIKSFQEFAGLRITGVLDKATKKMIILPRCGNRDIENMGDLSRRKRRYATQGSKWGRNDLTYTFDSYTQDVSRNDAESVVRRALDMWEAVTPLNFRKTYSRPDIRFKWAKRSHGDRNPFDGPGKTLAHAYFPYYGGDVHLDDDETWTKGSYSGTNLFQVVLHELGHSLGLSHSRNRDAIMAPFYRGYNSNSKLHSDDIAGIQRLYGRTPSAQTTKRPTPSAERTTKSTPDVGSKVPSPCNNGKVDAMTLDINKQYTYAFQDGNVHILNNYGVKESKRIDAEFQRGPKSVDAALTEHTHNSIYLFKDDEVWTYRPRPSEYGGYQSPDIKPIRDVFIGLPNQLDAAFVWSGNGRTYIFKGDDYYRVTYNSTLNTWSVDDYYPRNTAIWTKHHVSAAVQWRNHYTYFFYGTDYHRFNDRLFELEKSARLGYPRSINKYWFGCANANLREPETDDGTFLVPEDNLPETTSTGPDTDLFGTVADEDAIGAGSRLTAQRPVFTFLAFVVLFLCVRRY